MYETPFYVAVDHDKKKVVISIRGTLSPKVCCPRLLARPWGPPRRPRGVPLPVSCPQPRPSPVSSPHKDALTDLTGDAERLPVEGHHGTWLGHKVPTTWAPGGPWPSLPTASSWICPDGGGGGGPPCLLGSPGEIGQRGAMCLEGPPWSVHQDPCLAQILTQKGPRRQSWEGVTLVSVRHSTPLRLSFFICETETV